MEDTLLDNDEFLQLSKELNYREFGKDSFILTFSNKNLKQFYAFLLWIFRKHYRYIDRCSNGMFFTVKNLVKNHGTELGLYRGTWIHGCEYMFTCHVEQGFIGDEVFYVNVSSEDDDIHNTIETIHSAINDVKAVWGTRNLTERIFADLASYCKF